MNTPTMLPSFTPLFLVPPTVTRGGDQTRITANEADSVTLTFMISRADPPVAIEDIMWLYSRNFSETPFSQSQEIITGLSNRISGSTFTFSNDLLNLTISNIVQARMVGEDTDAGRYFLVATNPAGMIYSYYDLVVNG